MASTPLPSSFNHEINDFEIFYEKLISYFIANDICEYEVEKRKAILITLLSEETYKIVRSLCAPRNIKDVSFQYLVRILKNHFQPRRSNFSARIAFYTARKQKESVSKWAVRLRGLTADCQFGTELEVVLRDIFVTGMEPGAIQDRLKEEDASDENLTLEKLLKVALSKEAALREKAFPLLDIQKSPIKNKTQATDVEHTRNISIRKRFVCGHCGSEEHRSEDCRFKFVTCHRCGMDGHLPSVCQNNIVTKETASLRSTEGDDHNTDTIFEGWLSIFANQTIAGSSCWRMQYVVVSSKKISFYNFKRDIQNSDPEIVLDLCKVYHARSVTQNDLIGTDLERFDNRKIFQLLQAGEGEMGKIDKYGNMLDVRSLEGKNKQGAIMNKGHQFFQIYYYNPTTCKLCPKPLWNMFRPPSALECRKCRIKIHQEHLDRKEYRLAPCKVHYDLGTVEELFFLAPTVADQERWVCNLSKAIQKSGYTNKD